MADSSSDDDDAPMLTPVTLQRDEPINSAVSVIDKITDDHAGEEEEELPEEEDEEEDVEGEDTGDSTIRHVKTGPRVPVTIVTGWLGSGKTTMLQHVLAQLRERELTVAIINNEAGATGIDGLYVQDQDKQRDASEDKAEFDVTELGGGCVCCSVRSELVVAIEAMLQLRKFDYILIECSGMANPGPLASIFWVDDDLGSDIYLDGIISVVDSKHLLGHLQDSLAHSRQVVHQISFADRIILNKRDLVTEEQLEALTKKVRQINSLAEILCTEQSAAPVDKLLWIEALQPESVQLQEEEHAHEHEHDEECFHDHSIKTLIFDEHEKPLNRRKLQMWLADVLWSDLSVPTREAVESATAEMLNPEWASSDKPQVYRSKAVLWLDDCPERKSFLQGVHDLFEVEQGGPWDATVPFSRMVLIGRHLNAEVLEKGFRSCVG